MVEAGSSNLVIRARKIGITGAKGEVIISLLRGCRKREDVSYETCIS